MAQAAPLAARHHLKCCAWPAPDRRVARAEADRLEDIADQFDALPSWQMLPEEEMAPRLTKLLVSVRPEDLEALTGIWQRREEERGTAQ
jgi:hypothetical protein